MRSIVWPGNDCATNRSPLSASCRTTVGSVARWAVSISASFSVRGLVAGPVMGVSRSLRVSRLFAGVRRGVVVVVWLGCGSGRGDDGAARLAARQRLELHLHLPGVLAAELVVLADE